MKEKDDKADTGRAPRQPKSEGVATGPTSGDRVDPSIARLMKVISPLRAPAPFTGGGGKGKSSSGVSANPLLKGLWKHG